MVYADYGYYKTIYLGNAVPEADFPRLALRASERMDTDTFGRAAGHAALLEVKNCCCAVSEVLYQEEQRSSHGGLVQSESVGGQSRSYAHTEAELAGVGCRCYSIERRYLSTLGLLYRGV